MQWLHSQLCYVAAANQWAVVEIELLATVGWKWGCQPFSCRCSQNVTHCRKEICSTCLVKESIPAIPFGNFNHPLPATSRFLRAAARSTTSALWLHHAHPFVAAAGKSLSHAEKQRVWSWSRSCGVEDLLQCSDCTLSCAMWLLQTNELVEIELLATVDRKWGCQPFSCPCSQNVTRCQTRFGRHVCLRLRHPFPPFLFGMYSYNLNFYHKLEVPESSESSTLHQFCTMVASCPSFVGAAEKDRKSLMQRSRGFCHGVVVSKICYNAVIVLSVVPYDCCKPMHSCLEWAFSNSGLEVWLPAFQLPMFAKCNALPKRDLFDMFV